MRRHLLLDFLLQFENLAIQIKGERSKSDVVQKFKNQANEQINTFLDTTFAGDPDPQLEDVLYYLTNSNFINKYKSGSFMPTRDEIPYKIERGNDRGFENFAGRKRNWQDFNQSGQRGRVFGGNPNYQHSQRGRGYSDYQPGRGNYQQGGFHNNF